MATVAPPLGFLEPPGEVGGIGGIAGVVGAVVSAVATTFDLLNRFLFPPGAPGDDNWGAANNFYGPSPHQGGGRWQGIPGATGTWLIHIVAVRADIGRNEFYLPNPNNQWQIPLTHAVIGPFLRVTTGIDVYVAIDSYAPDGTYYEYRVWQSYDYQLTGTNKPGTSFYFLELTLELSSSGVEGFLPPPALPGERKAPPIIDPPTFPELPPPIPSPDPGPPIPKPSPDPGQDPTPEPNPPPFTNPGTGEPQRNPNPQPQPGFFPSTPQFFPIPIPNNPLQTNPNGSPQQAPIPGPKQTPTDSHVVGEKIINQPGPQPSLDGIAKEVGRIESKLASVMKSAPLKDPLEWDEIIAILRLLKDLFDGITDDEPQSAYQISSPCELDDQEQRIVFASTIAASTDKFGAIINRINAVADLLQHSKNLKQPLCPGQRFPVSGQAVTVNFTQID